MNFIEEKIKTIRDMLKTMSSSKREDITGFKYLSCGYKTDNTFPNEDAGWSEFIADSRTSGKDVHFWLHKKFITPAYENGKQPVLNLVTDKEGNWDATNPQAIIYLNGHMEQGMDINHTELLLDFDTEYDMYIYFYIASSDNPVKINASLNMIDTKIEKLYYDISVPLDSCKCFEKTSDNYMKIMKSLDIATGYLDLRQPFSESFYKSIDETIDYLEKEFYNKICGNSEASVSCVGHTHIDVAWLWTLAQTVEKTQRSFATVIKLMQQYPEYKFMSSQPQLYKYVKEHAPDLYNEIKDMIRQGRWEVEGAMWLEADCNLASGESLVRQILFGKRFMKNEFGVESNILWLPDVFGYSAALPQILKKSGVDKFVTSKISWNEFNKLPYDTFMWEGIDGTQLFTYFITAQNFKLGEKPQTNTTYVGYIKPEQVLGTWERYQQKEYNNETLITFGYGDGGGGPTKDMLEQQRRLSYGIPGIPKTKIEKAGEFLNTVEKNFFENTKLLRRMPKWVGELYLEFHRGTYTSIAKIKKNNRLSELLYQKAEALCILDALLFNGEYPQEEINSAWETILLNQFHDIIPGSSIFEVYEESDKQYAKIIEDGNNIVERKLSGIIQNIETAGGLWVYNPNSFECSDIVNHNGKKVFVENIPSFGWKVVAPKLTVNKINVADNLIENRYFRILFNEKGEITSLFDKENDREVIKQGESANQLQVFEDLPRCYDAWEIANYYKYKMWSIDDVIEIKHIDEGARAGLAITKKFLNSTVTQKIFAYENIRRIDFDTTIDWHEEHLLLKAAFPLDIHTNKAVYDIQFGNIERATHENTDWDQAKFEVCAHKWADMSDGGYGVSIINDCKYGHSTEGSTIKLTLLKCATYPNPHADKGLHQFTYSLYPHSGDFKEAGTPQMAYTLNQPLISREIGQQSGQLPSEYSLLSCSNDNIIIETVKKAEDSDEIIVRLYENHNKKGSINLKFGFELDSVYLCDLTENSIRHLDCCSNEVTLPISNYEIVTLKILGTFKWKRREFSVN